MNEYISIKRTKFNVEVLRQGFKEISELHKSGYMISRTKPYKIIKYWCNYIEN